jgi:hypothetical protein
MKRQKVSAEQMQAWEPYYVPASLQNERKAMREQDLLHLEISEFEKSNCRT